MAIELFILLNDDATEEEIKEIAREICLLPITEGVYRRSDTNPEELRVTHQTPSGLQ